MEKMETTMHDLHGRARSTNAAGPASARRHNISNLPTTHSPTSSYRVLYIFTVARART